MKMNKPYVKKYDEKGFLINPIERYISRFPNRKTRRKKQDRFMSNKKSMPLIVLGIAKYKKYRQFVTDKLGKIKIIEHYIK